jgi:hypothetical protein
LFDDLMTSIAGRFCRPEPRRRVRDFVRGLLAPLPRKNCWTIAEHAGDASGHAMLDTALYLPKSWCEDPVRRVEAGVPADERFATKPQLARRMIAAAVGAGLPCRWVAADEAYGGDPQLAAALRAMGLGTSWQWPVPTTCAPASASNAPTSSPPTFPLPPGTACRQAPAPKDTATTTGPGRRYPPTATSAAAITGC